ncbi:hypothetical protein ScPMuIL_006718 [Solemya velum]
MDAEVRVEATEHESPYDTDIPVDDFDPSKMLERSQSDASLTKLTPNLMIEGMQNAVSLDNLDEDGEGGGEGKVSECSKVYFDLSKLGCGDSDLGVPPEFKLRLKLGKSLETIPQDEELKIPQQHNNFSVSSENLDATSDTELSLSEDEMGGSSFYTKYPLRIPQTPVQDHISWQYKNNLKLSYQRFSQTLEEHIRALKTADVAGECMHFKHVQALMKESWSVPVYGRDLAYGLCDILRLEGVLDLLAKNCNTENKELLESSVSLLELIMSTRNRERVTKVGLEYLVNMAHKAIGNKKLSKITTGLMESIFKVSEETSAKAITLGGLDVILYWCRSKDIEVLRHCAKAIANLSLFGGADNQEEMANKKVPEWLFPLAFMEDNHVRYYACLAIAVLVANKEIEAAVIKSGTLELVIPFLNSTKPSTFAKSDFSHKQGRDKMWLKRLIPLLSSRREEAQALGAFHFAMEAGIKAEQGQQETFYEINAIEPLKKLASSTNPTASKLAAEALKIIGEDVPHKLTQQVPLWSCDDVEHWVSQIGFRQYAHRFQECQIDGDLLLLLTEEDLRESINMYPGLLRHRFLRELKNLKITADYSSCDPTGMDSWLMRLLPELSQYTYQMLQNGMDKHLLATSTEEELRNECGIKNGIHRRIILMHIDDLRTPSAAMMLLARPSMDVGSVPCSSLTAYPKAVDVFISYRRSTGSQLASLLKVHLQLRGFSVFLDIDRLRAGKFDENLLMNIKLARHFLLILTPHALDRCIGDMEKQDWVHREIVTALESGCNIIPVLDSFDWPVPENLPSDMQQVCYFNGIRWVHDYQDACVDKMESFLRGETTLLDRRIATQSSVASVGSVTSPEFILTPTDSQSSIAKES